MGQLQLGWLYTIYIPLSCLLRIGLTFFSSENVRRYIERGPCRSVARSLVLHTPRKEKLGYNLRNTQPGKSFLVSFFYSSLLCSSIIQSQHSQSVQNRRAGAKKKRNAWENAVAKAEFVPSRDLFLSRGNKNWI